MGYSRAVQEVDALAARGERVAIVKLGEQPYVLTCGVEAPAPPWDRPSYDIMFALPLAYDDGVALDAFYLRLPQTWNGQPHNRVSGTTIAYEDATWQLVSWHYAENSPYSLEEGAIMNHIAHCKGFFHGRGATNAKD